ncbi:MAG: MBL fold metallo-hydrolase [Betaproteobacteria bacterium]|nr:MBL fold metallo-hydrolase [Betaproteobacteria bacterium]
MGLTVKALHVGDILLDWSFLLFGYNPGRKTCIPINCFLILGAETPILVDTGVRDVSLFSAAMKGYEMPEQDIKTILREEGLEPGDIGYIIATHIALFPNARVVLQRKEMAFQASYKLHRCPDLPWFVSNPDRIELIDGDLELFPGIKCVLAIAHTGGHQHVEVQTDGGKVIMVGDTVYDTPMPLEDRGGPGIMWPAGNCYNQALLQDELVKLKWELKRGSLILPTHTYDPFDKYKLGRRRSDKRSEYAGFPTLDWPPKQ